MLTNIPPNRFHSVPDVMILPLCAGVMILPHQVLDRDCSTGAEGEGRSTSFFEPGQHLILNRGRNSDSESFFEGGSSITFKEIITHHYRCQIFSVATPMVECI